MKFKLLNLALCISAANMALADEHTHSGSKVDTLDSIIVTGEKQNRNLKDTSSSVSVIGYEKLNSTQYVTVRDAVKETPNTVVQSGVVPSIRGVEGNGAAGGFYGVSGGANARVSMLVDGVADPFLAIFAGDSGLWDVEQIEVFRGPQSTNNGRNSVAGAIYLKTKDPTFDWEGKVRLAYRDNEKYVDKAVMLSGPILDDELAFRFSGQLMDAQTLTNDDGYPDNPPHYDLNEFNSDKGRLKLLWTPNDDFEALLTYSSAEEQGDLGRRYYTNRTDYILSYPQDQKVENDSLSLKTNYVINDGLSLDVLIAGKDYTMAYDSYAATPAQEQQFSINDESINLDTKLNFGQNGNAFYGHLGLAYFEREQAIFSGGSFLYDGTDKSDSQALYGEFNYDLSDVLTLTGGIRYQTEEQKRQFNFPRFSLAMDESTDDKVFLPSVALQYDVTPDTRVGFSIRKGYNSGGFAVHPVVGVPFFYDKETVNAYELTTRSSFADNSLNLRANLFYNDYSDYQAANGLAGISNVDAETYGVELEASALISQDVEVSLGLGLLSSEVKDGGDVSGITGNDLSVAPEKTISIGATYYATNNLDLGASLKYTGGYYTDLANSENTKTSGYSVLNLTANYENGPWLVSAFINNVTDKEAVRNNLVVGPAIFVDIVEPRTFGASVTYSFF